MTPRAQLVKALSGMPDEAFQWLAIACASSTGMVGPRAQVWPDGIGGFSQASQQAIRAAQAAADAYLGNVK